MKAILRHTLNFALGSALLAIPAFAIPQSQDPPQQDPSKTQQAAQQPQQQAQQPAAEPDVDDLIRRLAPGRAEQDQEGARAEPARRHRRPRVAFGVRRLAAAFEALTDQSGGKPPHSKGNQ